MQQATAGNLSISNNIATFNFSGSGHNTFLTWKINEIASMFEELNIQKFNALVIMQEKGVLLRWGHEVNSSKGLMK